MTTKLCATSDFTDTKTKSFVINDSPLFIVKEEGQYFAYLNHCPHNHIPLDWDNNIFLDYDKELIQCSSHGAVFAIDSGRCLAGPCIGESLTKLEIEIIDNIIYLKEAL